MTDKIADHLLTKTTKTALAVLLSISALAQPANAAKQEWWFDVEVILFERNLDEANVSETFTQSQLNPPTGDVLDLLSPYLTPDLSYLKAGLEYCRPSNRLAVQAKHDQDFAFPLPADEKNASSSLQSGDPLKQSQQTDQGLTSNSSDKPEENFQYEVATTDIFSQSDDQGSIAQVMDTKDNLSNSEQRNSNNIEQQTNIELAEEAKLVRPLIQVEFIEWQIPQVLPCAYSEQITPSFASITPLQNTGTNNQSPDHIDHITRVPEIINGIEWPKNHGAFLLPASNMHMRDLYKKIKRQRDITPLLHLNWRQQVNFGRDNGQTIRLFAGQNFAQQFDANGLPLVTDTDSLFTSLGQSKDQFYIPEQELAGLSPKQQQALLVSVNGSETVTEDLFTRIDNALADNTPINIDQTNSKTEQQVNNSESETLKELWQLDGGITVYLRNVGRVPYLHIDSNLDFRQPIFDSKKAAQIEDSLKNLSEQDAIATNQLQQSVSLQPISLQAVSVQANYLQSANFNQLRRVISKQVHYFDHPLFGMVVRINRYRWPEVKEQPEPESQ